MRLLALPSSARDQLVPYFQKRGWSYKAGNGTWFIEDRRGRLVEGHKLPSAVHEVLNMEVEHGQLLGFFIRNIAREPSALNDRT